MKRNLLVIILLVMITVLFSCSRKDEAPDKKLSLSSKTEKDIVIGVSPLTLQLEYYVSYVQSMRKLANQHGVEVVITDSMWNTSKQISDLNDFIDKKVDAVICSPTDPDAVKQVLEKAEAAGIAVVIEMTNIEGIYPLVATDQREGGKLAGIYAGHWIMDNCGGSCEVAILDFPYFQNVRDRVEGFIEGLNETAPDAVIVARVDTKAKYETSAKVMEDLLNTYPGIRCVFGINDDSAKGANSVFESLDYPVDEICILGFDADNGAKKLIKAGRYLKGSVAADTDMIADACITTAIKKINGQTLAEWVEVQGAQYLITKKNIDLYQ